jgi:hypothetical protein
MAVKWNGHLSKPHPLPGGGAQGGELGQIEYLSQTNTNTDFLTIEEKFKFIDDLSILKVLNLAMCGISSYNFKNHIASDIGSHGQFLPSGNIKSQAYLDSIKQWTDDSKMALNKDKTKYMVINFTKKFQFSTRIALEDKLLEEVQECKLLGLNLTNQLSWQKNTESIVKRGNTRMIILQRLYNFDLPVDDMIEIYVSFIRSLLEYLCVVWHSSITMEESNAIERVQKTALKMILRDNYLDYQSALDLTGLSTLSERRKQLSLNFARKCLKSEESADLFPLNVKSVNTRPHEKYYVTPARTARLANSAIPYLQRLLNQT